MFAKSLVLATALVAGTAMVPASAENAFSSHLMQNWDENGDGKVTLQEVLQRREALFASFDANEDGFLDPAEMKSLDEMRQTERQQMGGQGMMSGQRGQMGQGPRQGMGKQMHANQQNGQQPCANGGQMRRQGWQGGPGMQRGYGQGQMGHGMGQQYGQQQYGQWNAPWTRHAPMRGPGWQGGPGMPRGYGPGQMGQAGQGMGRMMDANGDGKISKAEFVSMGERWFARFDRSGDGAIDASDF